MEFSLFGLGHPPLLVQAGSRNEEKRDQTTGQGRGSRDHPSLGSCLLASNFKSSENYEFDPGFQGHYERIYVKMGG